MSLMTSVPDRPTFLLIPAKDAQAFIKDKSTTAFGNKKSDDIVAKAERRADDIIAFASIEADRITSSAKAKAAAMEQRFDSAAAEIAERAAAEMETKQHALDAHSAMAQVTAIAADYATLEKWISDTIMSAVRSILADMAPQERCIGMIKTALAKTKERWNLSLSCHPDDYAMVLGAVAQGDFETAISKIQRDPSIERGVCYLKSEKDHFELNIETQLVALHKQIDLTFAAPNPDESLGDQSDLTPEANL
jgi:flagellar biosynthesis/type III secretory pathway protein FliH